MPTSSKEKKPSALFPLRPFATFRSESLCLGGLEGVFPGGGSTRRWGARRGHRHPDVWRFLGFNPHCHLLCTDGCFDGKGLFRVAPRFNPEDLKAIFEHHVFRMLLGKGKITQDLVLMLRSWRHSGFQVFVGPRILPREEEAMEKSARYIIRAPRISRLKQSI